LASFLVQAAVVVLLAGTCMAAGWWLFHRPADSPFPAPTAAPEVAQRRPAEPTGPKAAVETQPPKPVAAPVVKQSPPPAEPPSAKLATPASPPPAPKVDVPRPQPAAPKPAANLTFQKEILPLFQAKCISCHGANKKKGDLDVRSLTALLKGGDSGPAIDRQAPERSVLWESVAADRMPPGKNKFTESEKKKLHDWLLGGAK
jgi:hypothetical protein